MPDNATKPIVQGSSAEGLLNIEGLFRSVVESSNDAIISKDLDGLIRSWNQAAERIFGYTAAEMIGRPVTLLIPPDRTGEEDDILHRLRRGEKIDSFETIRTHKDGRLIDISVTISPIRNAAGLLIGASKVARDVTERKQTEKALLLSEQRFRAIFHSQFQFIGLMSPDGILLEANRTALATAGVTEEETLGKPFWETAWWVHDPEQQTRLREAISRAADGQQDRFEASHPTTNGSLMWMDFSLTPFRDDVGNVVLLIAEGRDISARKQVEKELREKSHVLQTVLDSMGEAVLVTDSTAGIVLRNRSFQELHDGQQDDEALAEWPRAFGLYLTNGMGLCSVDHLPIMRTLRGESVNDFVMEIVSPRHPKGVPVSVTGRPLSGPTGVTGGVIVIRDITDRIRSEAALRQSEQRFRNLADNAPVGIFETDTDGNCLFVNSRWCVIAGLTPLEAMGVGWLSAIHPEDRTRVGAEWYAAAHERREFGAEYRFRTPKGRVTWVSGRAAALSDPVGRVTGYIGMVADVSARRLAEQSLRDSEDRHRTVVESLAEGIVVHGTDGVIVSCNERACAILGLSRDQIAGRTSLDPRWEAVREDGSPFPGEQHPAMIALRTGRPVFNVVMGVRKANGESSWMTVNAVPLHGAERGHGAVVASFHDITESRRLHDRVRESLREKEVMLQEIHHRVKNNLAITISLFNFQMRGLPEGSTRTALMEAQARIRSMALVHEMLYQTPSLSGVALPEYVGQIVRNLAAGYAVASRVRTVFELVPLELPLESAIPFGLIVNELVSNSFKYAFPDDRRGVLAVTLRADSGANVELEVRDDGVGLPAGIDPFATHSFGLRLVRELARQLGGAVCVRRVGGTAFVVSFPIPVEHRHDPAANPNR